LKKQLIEKNINIASRVIKHARLQHNCILKSSFALGILVNLLTNSFFCTSPYFFFIFILNSSSQLSPLSSLSSLCCGTCCHPMYHFHVYCYLFHLFFIFIFSTIFIILMNHIFFIYFSKSDCNKCGCSKFGCKQLVGRN